MDKTIAVFLIDIFLIRRAYRGWHKKGGVVVFLSRYFLNIFYLCIYSGRGYDWRAKFRWYTGLPLCMGSCQERKIIFYRNNILLQHIYQERAMTIRFVNADYDFVQVNTVAGSYSRNFGLRRGESQDVDPSAPMGYAWSPVEDAILNSEFEKFAVEALTSSIVFGTPGGRVLR